MEQGRGNVQSEQNGTAAREPARNAALPSYFVIAGEHSLHCDALLEVLGSS